MLWKPFLITNMLCKINKNIKHSLNRNLSFDSGESAWLIETVRF